MQDQPFEKAYGDVLDLYANWLASHTEDVSRAEFKSDLIRYASCRVIVPTSWHTVLVIRADYGDDGGPAELIAFVEPLDNKVQTIVQSFDTDQHIIYERK